MNINNQFSSYESEFTQFLKQFKQQKPDLEAKQRQGRALLWDKEPVSLDDQSRVIASEAAAAKQQHHAPANKD